MSLRFQGRLAIKHHPDKNPDDPQAEERFKDIAIAYQTLSDDALRKKYNEFGPKESAPEGGYVDPEEVFGAIFGGERFTSIIGNISLARDMKAALQEAEEAEGEEDGVKKVRDAKGREILSEEEKAQKEEKDRKKAAEVCFYCSSLLSQIYGDRLRKLLFERRGFRSSWIILNENWEYSLNQQRAQMTPMLRRAGERYVN
jgi:curved DNA-binding protein CbpA